MTSISIGIVGAGEITRRAHLPVLINMPGVKVDWLSDLDPGRSESLGRAFGITAAHWLPPGEMPACDVVLLAIPVEARSEYLSHFAAGSTAVFCEKPFSLTASGHLQILGDFPAHALGCGYMRRFFRSSMLLRRLVAERTFGSLLKMDVNEGNRSKGSGVDSSFLDDARLGPARGVLTDLGSHSLDLALHISGADAFEVKSCDRVMDGSVDRKVNAGIELRLPAESPGTPVDLHYGVSWLDRQDNRIRLTFEHAVVWSELTPSSDVYLGDPDKRAGRIALTSSAAGATTYNQAFYLEWMEFLEGLRKKRESLVSARSALLTTTLVERLLQDGGAPND
jgi:predicted dehydrogenase